MIASSFWFWDKPSWGEAELWALAFLLIPSYFARRRGLSFMGSLVLGKDLRWSTSKASVILWTYAVLWAFVTILLHTRGSGLDNIELSDQYLLLLGIPSATAIAAAGVTQSRIASRTLVKPPAAHSPNVVSGIGQLFSDDAGNADLLDSQYLGFSVLLLAYFLTQFLSAESTTLPNLPGTLVGLTGVSAVGYVAKKGLQTSP